MEYRISWRLSAEAGDGLYADELTLDSYGVESAASPAEALRMAAEKVEQTVKAKLGEAK